MKKSILTIAILISGLFVASALVTSCGGKKEQTEDAGHHHEENDTTSNDKQMPMDSTQTAYACPMHPDITGKEGDKCSKCGMKLEAKAAEHKH